MTDIKYITFPIFNQFKELTCAFSTRLGGYSRNSFASLNMGNLKVDDPELVYQNRRLFYTKLGIKENAVALPGQIHSAHIENIHTPGIIKETDALITSHYGLFLGVQTADCLPLFIYAPKSHTVAVIHAGWRGVVQNIVPKTINIILSKTGSDPSDLYVAIGPGLQKECFEVRSDVFKLFPENVLSVHPDSDKRYLDLSVFIVQQLLSFNIQNEQIFRIKDCTKCNQERYYSYRRDGEKSGRMMGIIGLQK
jgi:YfiH family protein